MEQFVCNATITVKYKYKQIKPFLKCMNISQKTLIRTNEEGLLCCQFMVQVDSHTCYLEYFVSNNYCLDLILKFHTLGDLQFFLCSNLEFLYNIQIVLNTIYFDIVTYIFASSRI